MKVPTIVSWILEVGNSLPLSGLELDLVNFMRYNPDPVRYGPVHNSVQDQYRENGSGRRYWYLFAVMETKSAQHQHFRSFLRFSAFTLDSPQRCNRFFYKRHRNM
jgi:hypothetical protein